MANPMKKSGLHLGTSGWSYSEWLGVFYPTVKTPKLAYYSSIFDTVEVDSSFYSMPNPKVVFGWVKNTPAGFQFSLKLPKKITHELRLDPRSGVEVELRTFLKIISPLVSSQKLAVILAQLPPSLELDLDLLERFFGILPLDQLKFAIEFRHRSWWRAETWSILRRAKVANTIVDEPLLPNDLILTAPHAYVRWHGRGESVWYDYRYSKDEVSEWSGKLKSLAKSSEVYGYWNNHFHGNAVLNCLQELEILGVMNPRQKGILEGMYRSKDSSRTLFDFMEPSHL
jgi:uncharacterized protein YecE (DUF72 family)